MCQGPLLHQNHRFDIYSNVFNKIPTRIMSRTTTTMRKTTFLT